MRLLSVDFDFFFPKDERGPDMLLYDWGHKETPLMIGPFLWGIRASVFMQNGRSLPKTTGEERTFWDRVHLRKSARLFYAESHASICIPRVMQGVEEIWSFDAHHDAGYKPDATDRLVADGRVGCDEWAVYAVALAPARPYLTVVYPRWRSYAVEDEPEPQVPITRIVDSGETLVQEFDRVFVCRSGAWVPPWVDEQWEAFLRAAPIPSRRRAHLGPPLVDRGKWKEEAQRQVEMLDMFNKQNNQK